MPSHDRGTPEVVRIGLLGGFRVWVGSRAIGQDAWRLRKAASLIKLLALAPSHRLHRERAMDLLWPDSGKKAASNNLRQTLHAARRALTSDPAEGPRYLASEDESLVLCPEGELWVDVSAFEEAAATARRARDQGAYRAAIELYSGELLPADRYEEWAERRRHELKRKFISLLIELAGLYEEHGMEEKLEPAIEALQTALGEEPTNEEAHVGLMRVYALSGRQGEALREYVRLSEVLSNGLSGEPSASTRALREEIASGRFPADPSQPAGLLTETTAGGARTHNLPAQRTSFVGREREMLEVKRALAMTRLLTLTGVGGSGKTRLALEVARDLVGAYPDGVWLVELAGISEKELVPQSVAEALGVQEQPGRPLTDTLVESFGNKNMLLVLDNCEHLIYAAARLADALLDGCSRLRILVTSREALGVAGESLWPVPTLSVPDSQRMPTVAELEGFEAARLFVARVSDRRPGFALEPANAAAVAEVCRRLDGVPLAIELAAARVGTMSVEQIAERLGDSLGLLTGGSRTAVARQRTLRGALDWSHELLSNKEQILFGRLSVFAGGWTLEAVEAVAAGDGLEEGDNLELLSGLVDKSLVVAEASREGRVHYRLLEPVRQYALERLEHSGEANAVRRRHTEHFLALAEEAEQKFRGPEEARWLDRLEADHDNLRAALSWSLEYGETDTTLRLSGALSWFWSARGHVGEGARWLQEALSKGDQAAPTARAGALMSLGDIMGERTDFEQAEACLKEALRIYEELGDRARVAETLARSGWVAEHRGYAARAASLFEESLAAARESENRTIVPIVLNGLAWIAFNAGDFERAQALWKESLELRGELGSNMAGVLSNMGYTELARGNLKQAKELLDESLAIGRSIDEKGIVAGTLLGLGVVATLQGEPNEAQRLLKEALAIELELEFKAGIIEDLEALAEAAGALGEDMRAARLWGAAATQREAIAIHWNLAERMLHEPQLIAAQSRIDEALWEAGFAEGRAMALEKAVEYALAEEEPDPSTASVPERSPAAEAMGDLTRREGQVADLVARGLTNRQISEELFISERTVDVHVRKILKKLRLRSRTQIAARAGAFVDTTEARGSTRNQA
jgi:predicted ATPase/DNA-binding SARP family transcriptional activator/DNA-binding CsgD family transcriptional regulator/Tfp pilus assembly protein PilF